VPAPPGTAQFPAQVIDLANWYLTLPTGKQHQPDEVHQPQLNTFTNPWFHLDDTRNGVVFTANAGGVTTKNSTYPRSELREMTGTEKAGWSNTTGNHVLRLRQAVTQLPTVKPHVVTAQIHDTADDVIEVRLEGKRLLVANDNGNDNDKITLDPRYVLDTPFDLEIDAAGGHIRVSYNAAPKADIVLSGSGWYFKTGSYVQSNPARGDTPTPSAKSCSTRSTGSTRPDPDRLPARRSCGPTPATATTAACSSGPAPGAHTAAAAPRPTPAGGADRGVGSRRRIRRQQRFLTLQRRLWATAVGDHVVDSGRRGLGVGVTVLR
jgi:hypothetical protein